MEYTGTTPIYEGTQGQGSLGQGSENLTNIFH